MNYSNLLVEKKKGVAWLTLNRPDAMNALDPETHVQLRACLAELDNDPEVRVIVITGAGRAFSAGGDLKWTLAHQDDPIAVAEYGQLFHDTFHLMEHMNKINIAMINGHALAGRPRAGGGLWHRRVTPGHGSTRLAGCGPRPFSSHAAPDDR